MTYLDYTAPEGASTPVKPKTYVPCNRSLVQGVGVNDFPSSTKVNGRDIKSYNLWKAMLQRCYSADLHKKRPTYTGCTVAKEWHSFVAFEKWFTENYVEGWFLDKDILTSGNKIYSADTCVFVPQHINNLLLVGKVIRGTYPLGVSFHKANQKYVANIHTEGVLRYLGSFPTSLEAHQAWQLAKSDNIAAAETNDPRIRKALDLRVAQLRDDHANSRITLKL